LIEEEGGLNKIDVDLITKLGGISLKNPVLVAAGCFGYGEEYSKIIDLNKLGGIITKTITLHPKEGNPPPRLVETPAGLLNSIGLENPGVDIFIKEKLPFLQKFHTAVIVSIGGEKEEDYLRVAEKLEGKEGISALEINVSCPNVKVGGYLLGCSADLVFSLTKHLKGVSSFPLIVKLTPNVTDIVEIAQAAKEGGADAVSLINTILGMAVDVECWRPKLGNVIGGLSGPAIKPVAVRMVWEVHRRLNVPILGMGGIMRSEDAIEFILAGASAVAIGTANLIDPQVSLKIIEGIKSYMKRKGIKGVSQLIGKVRVN